MSYNFLGIEEQYSSAEKSSVVIVPIPYERTTSYGGGTKDGPSAIIEASTYVELYDEEADNEVYKTGIHTASPLEFTGNLEDDFNSITGSFRDWLKNGKFPVGLGGEHSISFPVYRAFHEQFENISVLQLDAHSDLRESYEGSPYSHASVMKRIYDINTNIVQIGIRSQCIEEADFIKSREIKTYYAHKLRTSGFSDKIIDELKENVFITIDVDYFDPSIIPSTGTPEPGGFLWYETLAFLQKVFGNRNVVGFDVVELSPKEGLSHPDFTIAKMIYKLLSYKFKA